MAYKKGGFVVDEGRVSKILEEERRKKKEEEKRGRNRGGEEEGGRRGRTREPMEKLRHWTRSVHWSHFKAFSRLPASGIGAPFSDSPCVSRLHRTALRECACKKLGLGKEIQHKLQIVDGEVDLCGVDYKTPYTQYIYILEGRKIMNPYLIALFAWNDTTTPNALVNLKGKLKVSFIDLLKCIMSLKGSSKGEFVHLFLKSLIRTYIFQKPRATLNYYLPMELNNLGITILEEGHEVWLLQSRLHPYILQTTLVLKTLENMISLLLHTVSLSIHMALLGGHVSTTHVSSLSCIKSSMFFKLNAFSSIKMWLPLVPLSMFILSKEKILPLLKQSKTTSQHNFLRWIARYLPRHERCHLDECEIFFGIFGNAYWHENLSLTLDNWLINESTTKLPMVAFPQLRIEVNHTMICNKGFIANSKGNSSYVIRPERIALEKVFPHILCHIRISEQEGNRRMSRKQNRNVLEWEDDLHEVVGFSLSMLVCFLLLSFVMFLVSLMMRF
ncbi:hypothetical protein K2173_021961 [Erythroxylum novogranatense]|uniref:Uncharacterized protein n=1 Tax=Erythroxylum novogranatense TaxID=1862640 RepID=A0AAV8T3T3_9ROSI|nr:hypothetical protein K2173_021961 [Erythroxylum novogranatense]